MPSNPDASIADRISDLQRQLDRISLDLDARIAEICAEAASKTQVAVKEADGRRRSITANLLMLGAASAMDAAAGAPPAQAQPTPLHPIHQPPVGVPADQRRSASEIILSHLAAVGRPVHSNELDAVVTPEGWSTHAAIKAKTKLRAAGLVSADDRMWQITEAGLRKLGEAN